MNQAADADPSRWSDLALAGRHRALTRVAPGLVHELRGPLNAVHLNVELLKALTGSVDDETEEKLRRYLGVVEEELGRFQERFDRFVEHVFPPSRQETAEVDLRRVVEAVGGLLEVQARKEQVELVVDVPDEPVVIEAAAGVLRDALLQMAVYCLEDEPSDAQRALRLSLIRGEGEARVTIRGPRRVDDLNDPMPRAASTLWEQAGGAVSMRSNGAEGSDIHLAMPWSDALERGLGTK